MNRKMMIKKKSLLKFVIFVMVFEVLCSCKEKKNAFGGKVYRTGKNQYGYVVSMGNKTVIKQENIPYVEGNVSFKDSTDALKTLHLVLEKLNSGKNPTLSGDDLKNLEIKH
jgi:hypothetical protein